MKSLPPSQKYGMHLLKVPIYKYFVNLQLWNFLKFNFVKNSILLVTAFLTFFGNFCCYLWSDFSNMKIGRAMLAPTINVISVKNSVFYIKKGDLTVSSKISVLKLILKGCPFKSKSLKWLRGIDSNYRPQGYEPCELPTAPPRDISIKYCAFYVPLMSLYNLIFIQFY